MADKEVVDIHIANLAQDISEIKVCLSAIKRDQADNLKEVRAENEKKYVLKEIYSSDLKRTHTRIDRDCVPRSEFDALKRPLWIIAAAVVGAIGKWLVLILEKSPEASQVIPPLP